MHRTSNPLPANKSTSNFLSKPDGLYQVKEGKTQKICSPIEVMAVTRYPNKLGWGKVVRLQDPDGNWKEVALPMRDMNASSTSSLMARLADMGLVMASSASWAKTSLADYLANQIPPERALCVPRPGWHGDCYVTQERTYAPPYGNREQVVLQSPHSFKSLTTVKGTLAEWQQGIGRYLPGNGRLLFAVSAAFAPPLLNVLGIAEGGGFHFLGGSSIGKTTLLQVAGSVWAAAAATAISRTGVPPLTAWSGWPRPTTMGCCVWMR